MMAAKKKSAPKAAEAVIDVSAEDAEQGTVALAKARIKEEANTLKSQAAEQARDFATQSKDKATGAIKDVSAALDDASKSVDQRLGENYGEYARKAAGAVATLAEKLEGKEVDDVLRDTEAFIRRSPVIAIGIAAVAGFAIARLVKSGLGEREDA